LAASFNGNPQQPAQNGAAADPIHDRPVIFAATRVSLVVISSGSAAGLSKAATSSAADGQPSQKPNTGRDDHENTKR
jgi:hypothetical protein